MQHGCETGVVIRRQLANPSGLFRLRIDLGIGAADEPEDGWRMPLNAERPEVFAGRSGIGLPYAIGGKM
jgi:hypothetical protein